MFYAFCVARKSGAPLRFFSRDFFEGIFFDTFWTFFDDFLFSAQFSSFNNFNQFLHSMRTLISFLLFNIGFIRAIFLLLYIYLTKDSLVHLLNYAIYYPRLAFLINLYLHYTQSIYTLFNQSSIRSIECYIFISLLILLLPTTLTLS